MDSMQFYKEQLSLAEVIYCFGKARIKNCKDLEEAKTIANMALDTLDVQIKSCKSALELLEVHNEGLEKLMKAAEEVTSKA